MPTLMQKIRRAFKGWSRRREAAQKEFVTRNVGWGEPGVEPRGAAAPSRPSIAANLAHDMDGLVVAFLGDSGVIAYYLDSEAGEVIDVRDGSALAAPRDRRVPSSDQANDAADRRAFINSPHPGAGRAKLMRAVASGELFRRALDNDRPLERAWHSLQN